jgi:hypothetical protein
LLLAAVGWFLFVFGEFFSFLESLYLHIPGNPGQPQSVSKRIVLGCHPDTSGEGD